MNVSTLNVSSVPLLKGLEESDIVFLDSVAKSVFVEAKEFLFQKGESAEQFFVIEEGTLVLELERPNNSSITLMTLNPGELIGWSWLFPPYAWNFDAKALNDCRLIAFDAKEVRRRMAGDSEFGFRVMQSLVLTMHDRLAATRLQLLRHHDD